MRRLLARSPWLHWVLAAVAACSSAAACSRPPPTYAATCQVRSAGVDTSMANGLDGPILGESVGQVFLASDTLLSSITVWRIASEDTNYTGWHLYIARADSTGRPVPSSVLLDGPTMFHPYGDGVHPIPIRFDFEPPFALPGPGHYEFAIQAYPCDAFFNMLLNHANAYPDGAVWLHTRSSECHLANFPEQFPLVDMVFTLEFCAAITPAEPATWGQVKARYH